MAQEQVGLEQFQRFGDHDRDDCIDKAMSTMEEAGSRPSWRYACDEGSSGTNTTVGRPDIFISLAREGFFSQSVLIIFTDWPSIACAFFNSSDMIAQGPQPCEKKSTIMSCERSASIISSCSASTSSSSVSTLVSLRPSCASGARGAHGPLLLVAAQA